MSTEPATPLPSFGRLIGDGFRHWTGHQAAFWRLAGPCALLLTAAKLLVLAGLVNAPVVSLAIALTEIVLLDQWIKRALFPDWTERAATLRQARRSASASWSVIGFCIAYCATGFIVAFGVFAWFVPGLFEGQVNSATLLVSTIVQALVVLVVSLPFASVLLFLPGRIAGLPWNLGDAYRAAGGMHGTLTALALGCTLLSLVGTALMVGLTLLQAVGWLFLVGQLVTFLVDFVALYLLAFGVARVFVAKTDWRAVPVESP